MSNDLDNYALVGLFSDAFKNVIIFSARSKPVVNDDQAVITRDDCVMPNDKFTHAKLAVITRAKSPDVH